MPSDHGPSTLTTWTAQGSQGLTYSIATDKTAYDDDQDADANHGTGDWGDVLHSRCALLVDEAGFDLAEGTTRHVLGIGPVHDLVDRGGEPIPGSIDVAYEFIRRAVVGTCATRDARFLVLGTAGHTILLDRADAAASTLVSLSPPYRFNPPTRLI